MLTIEGLLQTAAMASSGSAKLDAELLLCEVMMIDRAEIYAHPERPVEPAEIARFNALLHKRSQGYAMAHLLGSKEFWSLELEVNRHIFIPRPETECLVAAALNLIESDAAKKILDLGTGSGAIALAIASERPDCQLTAVDISPAALAVARNNAKQHGLDNIYFLESDWYGHIRPQRFDLILSNPPYIAQHDVHLLAVRHEPRLALVGGADGMAAIDRILEKTPEYLATGAYLLLEHGYDQGQRVRNGFLQQGFQAVQTLPDLAKLERVTYGKFGDG